MKLLRIILIFFAIYLIRRFFQFYKAMKKLQQERDQDTFRREQGPSSGQDEGKVVDADYEVIDR